MIKILWSLMIVVGLFSGLSSEAQIEVSDEEMARKAREIETGKDAASKYFIHRRQSASNQSQQPAASATQRAPAQVGSQQRYLALHIGSFIDDDAYKWGGPHQENVGRLNTGVTYRIGEWTGSMDLLFRGDFTTYNLPGGRPQKLSLLPIIAFPDAASQFPLYFGAGAGLGVFFKQLDGESALSFDYQIIVGARFFDVIDRVGFTIETGVKNHILLLSDGQFNGVFLSLGTVFQF